MRFAKPKAPIYVGAFLVHGGGECNGKNDQKYIHR